MSIDDEQSIDTPRTAREVAKRAMTLLCVVAIAFEGPRDDILAWLTEYDLENELSPAEAEFIQNSAPSKKQLINFGWHVERLLILAWALGLAEVPAAGQQGETSLLQERLPPYAEADVDHFLAEAKLRSEGELAAMADLLLDQHWNARDGALHDRSPTEPVNMEIVQERHHAINWIIGYEGLPWDEVTTDT